MNILPYQNQLHNYYVYNNDTDYSLTSTTPTLLYTIDLPDGVGILYGYLTMASGTGTSTYAKADIYIGDTKLCTLSHYGHSGNVSFGKYYIVSDMKNYKNTYDLWQAIGDYPSIIINADHATTIKVYGYESNTDSWAKITYSRVALRYNVYYLH
jgi:hypothetical protein